MEAAFDISHRDEALAIGELKPIVGVSAFILLSWENNACEEKDENKFIYMMVMMIHGWHPCCFLECHCACETSNPLLCETKTVDS